MTKDGLSHVLKRHMKGLYKKFRITVAPYLLKVKTHRLHKNSQSNYGVRVRVNQLEALSMVTRKRPIMRRRRGFVIHHPQTLIVWIEQQYLKWRIRYLYLLSNLLQ